MIEALAPARAFTTANGGDRLYELVVRIATGDRAAFRCLYASLAMRVWRDAVRVLPHPVDARAATRSTFVEVWHLAGHYVDDSRIDTRGWIAAIAARRVDDRLRASTTPSPVLGDYDRHVHRELAALLGRGPCHGPSRPCDLRPRRRCPNRGHAGASGSPAPVERRYSTPHDSGRAAIVEASPRPRRRVCAAESSPARAPAQRPGRLAARATLPPRRYPASATVRLPWSGRCPSALLRGTRAPQERRQLRP